MGRLRRLAAGVLAILRRLPLPGIEGLRGGAVVMVALTVETIENNSV